MLEEPILNTQFYSVLHDLKRAPGTPVRGQGSDHPESRDHAVEEGAAPRHARNEERHYPEEGIAARDVAFATGLGQAQRKMGPQAASETAAAASGELGCGCCEEASQSGGAAPKWSFCVSPCRRNLVVQLAIPGRRSEKAANGDSRVRERGQDGPAAMASR